MSVFGRVSWRAPVSGAAILVLSIVLFASMSGCKRGVLRSNEIVYVSAPQANLRDRVAAVYNKVGTVQNGEKLEVLDRQKRFVRVRAQNGLEGWIELRSLVDEDVFKGFEQLKNDNRNTPVQGKAVVRRALNLHVTPERDSDHLYQMKEDERVDILKRTSSPKAPKPKQSPLPQSSRPQPTASPRPTKPAAQPSPTPEGPPAMEDWWLVRDSQGHVGWALAQMVDIDIPLDIAQYAEGQRIMAAFVLNKVRDDDKDIPQYLVLMSDARGGQAYDYNAIRVFTWNTKRHRYETAYRERNLFGVFPVTTGTEDFGKEGVAPVFTIQVKGEAGQTIARKYRMIGPIVRRVLAPGENAQTQPKLARPEPVKKSSHKAKS